MVRAGAFARWVSTAACATALVFTTALGASAQPRTPDPHFSAVLQVCGRCHMELPFMGQVRAWPRWNDVFHEMSKLGATGEPAQLEQVTAYFLDHLTLVNVNSGSQDELAWVLDVDDEVAAQIVKRRGVKPFRSAAELATVPGVRPERLALLGERVQF